MVWIYQIFGVHVFSKTSITELVVAALDSFNYKAEINNYVLNIKRFVMCQKDYQPSF